MIYASNSRTYFFRGILESFQKKKKKKKKKKGCSKHRWCSHTNFVKSISERLLFQNSDRVTT